MVESADSVVESANSVSVCGYWPYQIRIENFCLIPVDENNHHGPRLLIAMHHMIESGRKYCNRNTATPYTPLFSLNRFIALKIIMHCKVCIIYKQRKHIMFPLPLKFRVKLN